MKKVVESPRAPEASRGPYHVFHHVYTGGAPTMYKTRWVDIKGAFVHLVDDDGNEMWLSGQITIRPAPRKRR